HALCLTVLQSKGQKAPCFQAGDEVLLTRVLDYLGFAGPYCGWLTRYRPRGGAPWHTQVGSGRMLVYEYTLTLTPARQTAIDGAAHAGAAPAPGGGLRRPVRPPGKAPCCACAHGPGGGHGWGPARLCDGF